LLLQQLPEELQLTEIKSPNSKPITLDSPALITIKGIAAKKIKNNLLDKGIEFEITEELKQKIVELGYSPVFWSKRNEKNNPK